jgi:16S rRNA A1518/A1519 N6-dimethyltransferase RsmA/KsgA/DIM1 with predicted DNA glycosylase/AP lyase activity
MLRSSLRTLVEAPETFLERAGIDATLRAEDVPVEGFATLAGLLGN